MVGQTVSHYRIVEKLGSGGMGVVYEAEDLKLKRRVALKFIPEDLAGDRVALERFRREAESASALNHPNICVVHDIDEVGGRPFMAMELVAGRTLDQVIGRKGLKLLDALRLSIQIADALSRAHAAGIVHRDLKPSNVMVTDDGLVKVLDFGLAKLTEPAGRAAETATRLTADRPRTEEGTIVGTVAYMSPEQAQGRPVDARSDIFSFGAVLYEMLTGRRPFAGESKISTLGAILHKDPVPITEVGAAVPAEVERIVARCLRKDPQRRWQTMSDLKIALQDAKEDSESGKLAAVAPPRSRARRWTWLAASALAVAVIATVAAAVAVWWTPRPAPAIEIRPERFTVDAGVTDMPAISQDGRLIAYASDRSGEGNFDIYVQQANVGQPARLTRHEADDYDPTFSPDGSQIVFRSERDGGGLYITETLGGTERLLVPGGRSPSFSPDGSTIAYLADRATGSPPVQRIFLVPARGGAPRAFHAECGVSCRVLRPVLAWSPDGKYLAFTGYRDGSPPAYDWWVAPLDGGPPIATGGVNRYEIPRLPVLELAGWHREHLYFFRGSLVEGIHLFRAPIQPGIWKTTAPAQELTSGGGVHFSVSMATNGAAAISVLNVGEDFVSLPLARPGPGASPPPTKVTADSAIKGGFSITRDGAVAAYAAFVSWETGRIEVRVRTLATGRETVYRSENLPTATNPQISPDGSLVAYSELRDHKLVSFVGPAERLPGRQICEDCQVLCISSESRWALVRRGLNRLVRLDLASGVDSALVAFPSGRVADARLSPDDRWVAFVVSAPGRPMENYISPVGSEQVREDRWLRIPGGRLHDEAFMTGANGTARSTAPVWSADGSEIYYFSDRDGHACIWGQRLDPQSKEPVGAAYALYHLHRPATSAGMFGNRMFLSASRDKLVLPEWTVTGNLWTARLETKK